MVTLDKAVIARLQIKGKRFELWVDPILAYDFRYGKKIPISKLLAVNEIYFDAKKGERVPIQTLIEIFKTSDIILIAERIVKEGEIQITTEFRKGLIEEKKKEIAGIISMGALNPQTALPHPIERILNSINKTHFVPDPFKPAEDQVDDCVSILKQTLPLSFEHVKIKVSSPPKISAQIYSMLKEFGNVNAQWLSDGSLIAVVTVPPILKERLFRRVNSIAHGDATVEVI